MLNQWKRGLSAAAALTLTLSLGASALAYSGTITLNGIRRSPSSWPSTSGTAQGHSNIRRLWILQRR